MNISVRDDGDILWTALALVFALDRLRLHMHVGQELLEDAGTGLRLDWDLVDVAFLVDHRLNPCSVKVHQLLEWIERRIHFGQELGYSRDDHLFGRSLERLWGWKQVSDSTRRNHPRLQWRNLGDIHFNRGYGSSSRGT